MKRMLRRFLVLPRRGMVLLGMMTILFLPVSSQEFTGEIRGTVKVKTSGEPLAGANILVVGTNKGTTTDYEGAFVLKAMPPGQYTIVARFIGYVSHQQSVTATANQTTEINFSLDQDILRIDEVVVTGLSGEIPRSELGNAISKISGSTIEKVLATNVLDALAAQAPGIQITRSNGTPGSGTYVTIRGRHTISQSSQPLYVVDGMIIDNTTAGRGSVTYQNRAVDINPNDIESIEILKGASAAAIYGSRAANGVVLITTKSGKQTAPGKFARVTYTTSYTTEEVPSNWPLQTKYGQRIPYAPFAPGSTDSWARIPIPAGTTGSAGGNLLLDPSVPTFGQSRGVFQRGNLFENTLTISGGSQAFKYLVSGTLTNQRGTVINSDMEKRTFRANLNYSVLDNLVFTSNSNYVSSLTNNPQDGSNVSGILLSALRSPPEFDYTKYLEADGLTQRRYGAYDNPLWSLNFNKNFTQLSRFIHSTGIEYDVMSGLRLSGKIGLDRYDQALMQRLFFGAASTTAAGGSVAQDRVTNNVVNTELLLTAKERIGDDFLLSFIGGQQLSFIKRNRTDAGSTSTLPFFDEIPAGATPSASSSRSESRVFGYFGQLTASAWEKLTLTGAVRYDGGSTFGEDQRWFLYA